MSTTVATSIIGFNFWIINKIKIVGQVKPSIILGTHWCKGAAPIFKNKATKIINRLNSTLVCSRETDIIMYTDAIACVRKYFKLASEDILCFFFNIRGTKESILISKANQAINQEFAEQTSKIDINKDNKKSK